MVSGFILVFSQIGFVIGIFLLIIGVLTGVKEQLPLDWQAMLNGKLISGLFLIIISLYWIYRLTGSFSLV